MTVVSPSSPFASFVCSLTFLSLFIASSTSPFKAGLGQSGQNCNVAAQNQCHIEYVTLILLDKLN